MSGTTLILVMLGAAFAALNVMKLVIYIDTPKREKKTSRAMKKEEGERTNEFAYMFYKEGLHEHV